MSDTMPTLPTMTVSPAQKLLPSHLWAEVVRPSRSTPACLCDDGRPLYPTPQDDYRAAQRLALALDGGGADLVAEVEGPAAALQLGSLADALRRSIDWI